MNITTDVQYSAPQVTGADTSTITYKSTASTSQVWGSGYSLDIADKVMDDKAYQGQGMTAEDIMQQAQDTNVHAQKDFMIVMSNCVSGEDLEEMSKEGFDPGSTDVKTYVSMLDQIKVTLAKAGVHIAGYTDNLDTATVKEITGSTVDANALASKLVQADLPITQENIEEILLAMKEAMGITGLSEDAMKYMIMNHKAPSIENLYRAQFSSATSLKQAQGYYGESISGHNTGYYAKKADSIQWDNLQSQIDKVIEQSGLANTTETQGYAKWLVESGIELTADNLTRLSDLKNIAFPQSQEQLMDTIVTALHNGRSPLKALLTGEIPVEEQAQQLLEDVASITDEAIQETVESGKAINIKNLVAAQKDIDAKQQDTKNQQITENQRTSKNQQINKNQLTKGEQQNDITQKNPENSIQNISNNQNDLSQTTSGQIADASLREIEARRQLEEIRLMMTLDVNRQLLKSGYQIDTTQLSELVEALKKTEQSMKAALFQGETIEENELRASLYEDALTKTKELASMPAAVIGKAIQSKDVFTLSYIHEEGTILKQQYTKAGETYEALMTAPRADLGDRISKAFQNVDDILADMNLEINDSNRRAVRILGYNSMEITLENIDAVKEADSQVISIMKKMTPATTLQMIREQMNPLEMSMEELENYLNDQKDLGKEAEKFSKYLQKLDHQNAISEEEREAYIGIYRMFRQIEKSDGAVIGNLVATGAEMNFKNMLSAVRTRADKNMDIRVDDGYGSLENLITKGNAIDEQIMAGFAQEQKGQEANDTNGDYGTNRAEIHESQMQTDNADANKQKEKYYARMSGDITDKLAHEASVEQLQSMDIRESTTIEDFEQELSREVDTEKREQSVQSIGTKEQSKSVQIAKVEIPIEQSQNVTEAEKQKNLQEFQQTMKAAKEVEDAVLQTLIDYEQSVSVDNIQSASMLMMDRGYLFKQVFGKAQQLDASKTNTVIGDDINGSVLDVESAISTEESTYTNMLTQAADQMITSLESKETAVTTYQELVSQATKVIEEVMYQPGTKNIDVKAAKALYKGLSFAGKLSKQENYEIPMNIKGELTSVNLKIYHDSSEKGKVSVTMDTETLGKVVAEFTITDQRISGMLAYERKDISQDVEQVKSGIEKEMQSYMQTNKLIGNNDIRVSISLARVANLDLTQFGQDREPVEKEVPTATLYHTAKACMTALKSL